MIADEEPRPMMIVSVHCVRGAKSPVHRRTRASASAGKLPATAMVVTLRSWTARHAGRYSPWRCSRR